jgi:uncharacterized membrane protein
MFTDYPSLHPLAVHFPIVLILLAMAFQVVVTCKLDWVQIRWATLLLMTAAFFSALAASTFFHAMLSPSAPKSCWVVFTEHEKYAQYTLWMSGATLLLKAIGDFYKINRRSYEVVVLIAAILTSTFLTITGHHGARLTHIEGVGPMGRYLGTEEDEMNMENGGTMGMGENKKDTSMKMMNDSISSMKNMPGGDTLKKLNNMNRMNMENSVKVNSMQNNKNGMSGMNMNNGNKNNPAKIRKDDMKGMDMGGMSIKKDSDKSKKDDMSGMDMGGMNNNSKSNKDSMKGMNMEKKNAMDTISLEDNNPRRKPKKKTN